MSIEAYLAEPFQHTHETRMFDGMVAQLNGKAKNNNQRQVLIGNLSVNGREFDALYMRRNTLCVIDFKNYGGSIRFSENGPWFADDIEVRGGNQDNPFRQIRTNKFGLLEWCKRQCNSIVDDDRQVHWYISGMVIFPQSIQFYQPLPYKIRQWFCICDLENCVSPLLDMGSEKLKFTDSEIANFLRCFGISEAMVYNGKVFPKPQRRPVPVTYTTFKLLYHDRTGFRESLQQLRNKGGVFQQAYARLLQAIEAARQHGVDSFYEMQFDEVSQVKNCISYHLNHICRLAVIRQQNLIVLGCIGTSEDVIRWANAHKGMTIVVDVNGRIVPTVCGDDTRSPEIPPASPEGDDEQTYFGENGMLPELDLDALVESKLIRQIGAAT